MSKNKHEFIMTVQNTRKNNLFLWILYGLRLKMVEKLKEAQR